VKPDGAATAGQARLYLFSVFIAAYCVLLLQKKQIVFLSNMTICHY